MFREARLGASEREYYTPLANILVIEDNSSDVFLLRRALFAAEGDNFQLEIAADGERALELIQNPDGNRHPCVIVLDLHIPKHDGLEILRALRRSPELNHIRVLVTTNAASPREVDELRKLGVEFRLKPRDLSEFAKLAGDLVSMCKDARPSA